MNAKIDIIALGNLANFTRIWLVGHRQAIRHAQTEHDKRRAQNEARDFWKLCFNGRIAEILIAAAASAGVAKLGFGVDPWILQSELEELYSECVPGANVLPLSSGPSCDVASQLQAILENQNIIAGLLNRHFHNERRTKSRLAQGSKTHASNSHGANPKLLPRVRRKLRRNLATGAPSARSARHALGV